MLIKKTKKEKMAQRDVELARRISLVIIEINREAEIKVFLREELLNPLILGGRISVIGPSGALDKVLLMEVGIGPTRPYHAGWMPSANGHKGLWFRERKKFFEITEEQYRTVAPLIFCFIQFLADKRVSGWKCNHGNLYSVKMTRKWWSHRKKRMYNRETNVNVKPATRFSVSTKDNFIVSDVFSAELDLNETLKFQLKGLANFVDKLLKRYRSNEYKGKKSFNKLKAAQYIQDAVDRLPNYHTIEMLKHLPLGEKNVFYRQLTELFKWNGVDKTVERKSADSVLPGSKKRFRTMQLRVVSVKNDDVVFEVEARPLPAK